MQKDNTPRSIAFQHLTPEFLLRFWINVEKTDGCWLWKGTENGDGYGIMQLYKGRMVKPHRVSWTIHHGLIPEGLHVLHNCPGGDNTLCVNPSHLWLGTNQDNVDDKMAKGRFVPFPIMRGEASPLAKLTDDGVREIRSIYAAGGVTIYDLAKDFGVAFQTISKVIRRKTWKHV